MSTINIFVSYSHDDSRWVRADSPTTLIPKLEKSLRKESVVFWYDREQLFPGDKFRERIEHEIEKADIAILLISEWFFSSEFIEEVELPRIKHRANRRELVMIPILVESCEWQEKDFLRSRIVIPDKPLINYTVNDRDWTNVRAEILKGIRKTIRNLPFSVSSEQTNETLQSISQPEPASNATKPLGKSSKPAITDAPTLPLPPPSALQSFTEELDSVKLEILAILAGKFPMGLPDIDGNEFVRPHLFTASSSRSGVAVAIAVHSKTDGTQTRKLIANLDGTSRPIDLGPPGGVLVLLLYGTGIRNRSSLSAVTVTIGGVSAEVQYAGAQTDFVGLDGLDQINVRVPRSLIGRGEVDLVITVDGKTANTVRVNIK